MCTILKVCSLCKCPLALTEFNKNKRKKDGFQTHCRECGKKKSKDYYHSNKEEHYKNTKERSKKHINMLRQYVYDYVSKIGCSDCGEKNPACLDFDHTSGEKKELISRLVHQGVSLQSLLSEIDKCTIRCSNCHRKKTARDFNWYKGLDIGSITQLAE